MANILGRITINQTLLYEVDADPSVLGLVSELGDLAINANTGEIYRKSGVADTAWKNLSFDNFTQQESANGTITTTSTAYTLVTGMTITPPAGSYLVFFQGSVCHGTNNATTFFSTYAGGTQVTNSQVEFNRANVGNRIPVSINAVLATVNGAQAIETRWRVSTGTGTLTGQRYMSILRVS